jgi:hypothetical protein
MNMHAKTADFTMEEAQAVLQASGGALVQVAGTEKA